MNVGRVCARYRSREWVFFLGHRCYSARAATPNNLRLHHLPSPRPVPLLLQGRGNRHFFVPSFRCFASANRGGDDGDDEEWMPPDDSPLVTSNPPFGDSIYNPLDLPPGVTLGSSDEIPDGEIEVIDLEATLKDPRNQQYLQDELGATDDMPSTAVNVELEDVGGWKEVLKELRDDGQIDLMNGLVEEYNLQEQLAALEDDEKKYIMGANDIDDQENDVSDEEEWDEEFEQSLEGLSQEELVDELIENSPSLSQLEMEILAGELDRGEGGLDFDSLEETNLDGNAAYSEFRAMVLDDYNEKKEARSKKRGIVKDLDAPEQLAATTNFSTKSDFSEYPPDWKDYDSTSAFQRDFSDNDDSWVPPSSQFTPSRSVNADQGENTQDATDNTEASISDLDNTIDWLQARRSRLGGDENDSPKPTHLLTPEQAESFRHQNSQIKVLKHTLFTTSELETSLSAQGGTDIHIIDTKEYESKYGVGPGCRFIMLITGRNASHIRVLAESVVRNLKARKLDERGVMGAMQGVEGGQDIFTNKRSRNRARRNGVANTSGKMDDDWMVIDCDNIHVHILDETTRRCLNIEGLWDLSNPNSEGSKLRRIDLDNEDQVDDYIASNPIPDEYAAKIFGGTRTDGWFTGGAGGRVDAVPVLTKKSFSEKWSGIKRSKRSRRRSR